MRKLILLLLSVNFFGLLLASDSTNNKNLFAASVGYGITEGIGNIIGSLSYGRYISPKFTIGFNAEMRNYLKTTMIPITLELRKQNRSTDRASFMALAQAGVPFWTYSKTYPFNGIHESRKGKFTWGVAPGIQFRSKKKMVFYTLAKMQVFYLEKNAYYPTDKEPYYTYRDALGTLQLVIGLRFK
jgi:hypothetical protein